jgi:hypothetical protein
MMLTDPPDNADVTHKARLIGKRLYSPSVIAGHCVFAAMPVGLAKFDNRIGAFLCRK